MSDRSVPRVLLLGSAPLLLIALARLTHLLPSPGSVPVIDALTLAGSLGLFMWMFGAVQGVSATRRWWLMIAGIAVGSLIALLSTSAGC
jgi:hypothetical protein